MQEIKSRHPDFCQVVCWVFYELRHIDLIPKTIISLSFAAPAKAEPGGVHQPPADTAAEQIQWCSQCVGLHVAPAHKRPRGALRIRCEGRTTSLFWVFCFVVVTCAMLSECFRWSTFPSHLSTARLCRHNPSEEEKVSLCLCSFQGCRSDGRCKEFKGCSWISATCCCHAFSGAGVKLQHKLMQFFSTT